MLGRWIAVVVLLAAQTSLGDPEPAADKKMPGIWLEVEHAAASGNPAVDDSNCSGGKRVNLEGERDLIVFPLKLEKPIDNPQLFVRYVRFDPQTPARVRLSIVPQTDRPANEGFSLKPVEISLPRDPEIKNNWAWAAVRMPKLPAGLSMLVLQPVNATSTVLLDIIGIVDRDKDERWIPPQTVKAGRFTDAGVVGGPLRIERLELRSPVRLVYGDDAMANGVTFDLSLHNVTRQPLEADVTFIFSNEAGEVARFTGPRVKADPGQRVAVEHRIKPPAYGWFRVTAVVGQDAAAASPSINLGVLRRAHGGAKPDSMFGMNIGHHDIDRLAAEMMGIKWRRFEVGPALVSPKRGEFWTEPQVQKIRDDIARWRDAGVMSLGVVSYNAPWNVAPGRDGKPADLWRNRPLDLNVHTDLVYRLFKDLRKDITIWEIWNEPWVAGWTWQTGTAQDYRDMSKLIWDKVKPDMPEIQLIGGGSTSYQRDVLFAPGCREIGYADGCSSHPYNMPDRNMPSAAAVEAVLLKRYSKSGGGAGIWATEVSSPPHNFPDMTEDQQHFTVGRCIAPLYLLNRIGAGETPIRIFYYMSHWGRTDDAFNIWLGKDPSPAVVAYSALTHFLEDGKLQGDLLAKSTAMWAPMFTNPDGSSVIAFWAEDGYRGRMMVPRGPFTAYDHLGAEIPIGPEGIKFDGWGVIYLVSKQDLANVKNAFSAIEFDQMDFLRINPRSFAGPLDKLPPLRLKVQNLLPQSSSAEITVSTPPEIELKSTTQRVEGMAPGEIRYIEFPLKRATPTAINRYKIDYTATLSGQPARGGGYTQKGTQVVQAAFASFGTATVDGKLDDWQGVTPVTMLSRGGKDFTEAALNPDRAAAILSAKMPTETVAYKLWTRWDEKHLYLAAEVPDATPRPPTKDGDGFVFDFDSLIVALDCLEPNPDDFFVDHPLREKCFGSEVDFEFAAALAKTTDGQTFGQLTRLKAPGTNYQTHYATNVETNPPLGIMADAVVAGAYDEAAKVYRYEVAIPWTAIGPLAEQLRKLQLGEGLVSKMAFGVTDALPGRGRTFWTQEAGDLQSGAYGFSPSWTGGSVRAGGRILTDWGFVR